MKIVAIHFPTQVMQLLPPSVAAGVADMHVADLDRIEELRLRLNRPVEVVGPDVSIPVVVTQDHLQHVLAAVTGSSLYAVESELRRGYITIAGGHRVGIAGRAVVDERGLVKTIRDIGSVSIRIARPAIGSANALKSVMVDERGTLLSTLLIGPPMSGKTTLLRDVARMLGDGRFHPRIHRMRVSIVDERSEIAGCYKGVPQFDVGLSTDVLDACPKVDGMYMMLRAMAPQVLLTDEIGSASDIEAIADVARAGVVFVGTLHASSIEDLRIRETLHRFVESATITRFVFLSRISGPGTVARVFDGQLRELSGPWQSR